MDCAVIPLSRHKHLSLIQTVDFFYPLVDDPLIMGKIAFANVVSDVYAVGVTEIDNISLIISVPEELDQKEQDVILPLIAQGFKESAELAAIRTVHIQNAMLNPWCIIGGIASAVVPKAEVILPCNAKSGSHLVLTKALGTQLATNASIWLNERNEKYMELSKHFSDNDIEETTKMAINSMSYLNRNAAILMQKYEANAATDVTGFGLLGHAQNLAEFQKDDLKFVITTLPIFKNVLKFGKLLNLDKKLRSGMSVETSGGLLISLPADKSKEFCKEFNSITKGEQQAWIVGYVADSDLKSAVLSENPEFIEVDLALNS